MTEQELQELRKALELRDAEIDQLRRGIGRRDTYIHELHLAREADRREIWNAYSDSEDFVRWLREAEGERDALLRRVAATGQPRGFSAWLGSLLGKPKKTDSPPPSPAPVEVPGAPFFYHLKTSPYRVFRDPAFVLEGWALPRDGQTVTGLRVRIDDEVFSGTYGIDEPGVAEQHGVQANNPKPGFKIVIDTPPGRHRLSLEALLSGRDWVSILTTPIWVKHADRGAG